MTTNEEAFDRARAVLPGGVNSPVRAYGSVGGAPRSFVSATGAHVTDIEGREYIDLVGAWGPALLGHAHPPRARPSWRSWSAIGWERSSRSSASSPQARKPR